MRPTVLAAYALGHKKTPWLLVNVKTPRRVCCGVVSVEWSICVVCLGTIETFSGVRAAGGLNPTNSRVASDDSSFLFWAKC